MTDLHELATTLREKFGESPSSVEYLLAHPHLIPSPPRVITDEEIMARSMDAFEKWLAEPQPEKL
jgi:hypothetical protein